MYNPVKGKWIQRPIVQENNNSGFFICQVVFNVVAMIIIICLIVTIFRDRHHHMYDNNFWSPVVEKMEECVDRYRCDDTGAMVCGSDGLIYDSECKLKVTACQFPEMNLKRVKKKYCSELQSVTLVGGNSPNEGNVYARNPNTGIFGPVCDDAWDVMGAYVVCRQLNYLGVLRYSMVSYFGSVTPMFSYDDVKCVGLEGNIDYCRHIDFGDCGPNEAAGVICDDGTGQGSTWVPTYGPNSSYPPTTGASISNTTSVTSSNSSTTAKSSTNSSTSQPASVTTTTSANTTSTSVSKSSSSTAAASITTTTVATTTAAPTTTKTTTTTITTSTTTSTTTTTAKAGNATG